MTRNTNACENGRIVDERSATGGRSDGFADSSTNTVVERPANERDRRAVNDDLLATLAEVDH